MWRGRNISYANDLIIWCANRQWIYGFVMARRCTGIILTWRWQHRVLHSPPSAYFASISLRNSFKRCYPYTKDHVVGTSLQTLTQHAHMLCNVPFIEPFRNTCNDCCAGSRTAGWQTNVFVYQHPTPCTKLRLVGFMCNPCILEAEVITDRWSSFHWTLILTLWWGTASSGVFSCQVDNVVSGTDIIALVADKVSAGFLTKVRHNWLLCIALVPTPGGYGGIACKLAGHTRHGGAHGRICKYRVHPTSTNKAATILVRILRQLQTDAIRLILKRLHFFVWRAINRSHKSTTHL